MAVFTRQRINPDGSWIHKIENLFIEFNFFNEPRVVFVKGFKVVRYHGFKLRKASDDDRFETLRYLAIPSTRKVIAP